MNMICPQILLRQGCRVCVIFENNQRIVHQIAKSDNILLCQRVLSWNHGNHRYRAHFEIMHSIGGRRTDAEQSPNVNFARQNIGCKLLRKVTIALQMNVWVFLLKPCKKVSAVIIKGIIQNSKCQRS